MADGNYEKGTRLAVDAIVLTASKIAASINMILLFAIMSYTFSKEDYGSFRQIWLIVKGLIVEVFALGIPVSLFYFLPKLHKSEKKIFVLQTLLILSFLGMLASCLFYVFAEPISTVFDNPALAPLLRLFCLYALFFLPTLMLEGVLVSIGKTTAFAVYTIIDRVLLLLATGTTILVYNSINLLCIVFVVFSVMEFTASIAVIFHYLKPFKMISRKFNYATQLKFSIPIGSANIVDILNIELDKIVISSFFSVSQFARYANGAFQIPFIGTVAGSVNSILMPEFVKYYQQKDIDGLLNLWHNSIQKVALLFYPTMVFFLFFRRSLLHFSFPKNMLTAH